MDKNEKLKLGDIFLAPKEFFLNNSDGKLKQKIESYAEVRKDGRVMCAVVEDVNSVFPNESLYTIAVKQNNLHLQLGFVSVRIITLIVLNCFLKKR